MDRAHVEGHVLATASARRLLPELLISNLESSLGLVERIGHPLVRWRNRSPRTGFGNLMDEPSPLRFPDDHLPVDAADDGGVVNDRVVVVGPISVDPSLDPGLGA